MSIFSFILDGIALVTPEHAMHPSHQVTSIETTKHDGNLDDMPPYSNHCHCSLTKSGMVVIDQQFLNPRRQMARQVVDLDPSRALSLLVWLQQEEATLKKLAKEQVNG